MERVKLRKMINLDQVEDLLSNLVDTVDRQEKEIEDLKLLCNSFTVHNVVDERFREVQSEMENMSIKVNRVQASATSRLEGKELSAGELSTFNTLKIQSITEALAELATRSELHEIAHTIVEQHHGDSIRMREWAAPIEVTRTLQKSHQDISARVTGIEGLVACKLDRSELGHIEALAARLQQHEDFKQLTSDSLIKLDKSIEHLITATNGQTIRIKQTDNNLQGVLTEIRKLAPKSETRALAKEIEVQAAATKLCAREDALNLLTSQVLEVNVKILEGKEHSVEIKKIATETVIEMTNKANVQDVRACVIRKHYDQAVTALGAAIDDKARQEHLQICEARVKHLEEELVAQDTKLSIAMRFVEWFTSRGENYEHNMKTIDKHLSNLAKGPDSNPLADRTPYNGQIRFTSVLADRQSQQEI